TARQAGDVEGAARHLEAYLSAGGGPSDEDFLLERMLLRAQQGEVDPILKSCQSLVEQDHPATARILDALVQGYLRRLRLGDADVTVNIWLDRLPDHPQALHMRGWVREHRGVPERAAEDYERVLQLDPGRDDVRFRLASSLLDASRPAEALTHLEDLCRRH